MFTILFYSEYLASSLYVSFWCSIVSASHMTSRRDFNPFLSTCAAGKSLNLPMDQVFNIGIIRSSDKWLTQQQALGMMYTLYGQLSILWILVSCFLCKVDGLILVKLVNNPPGLPYSFSDQIIML